MERIPARWYTRGPRRTPIRLIVLHSMESAEMGDTAELCARYFATTSKKSSAHVCADVNSLVRCVDDDDIAYAAPGANHDGLHIEMAGTARQSREQWLDEYGEGLLSQVARQLAEWSRLHEIPLVALDAEALLRGERGVTTHWEVTKAYRRSDHWDPGPNFPMDVLLARARRLLEGEAEKMFLVRNADTGEIRVAAERAGVGARVPSMAAVEALEATGVVVKAPNGERWADLPDEAFRALPGI